MDEITKLQVSPAYQVVSDELQRLILEGILKPGDQLPAETELADRFGVNRSTLREGIRQLESEGLLRRVGRRRLLITIPDQQHMSVRMERALLLHAVRFRELWEVANALEPLSAALAAQRITDDQIHILEKNLADTESAIAAGTPTDGLDTEFHAMLAKFTGNRALVLSREPIGRLLFKPYLEIGRILKQAPHRNLVAHREVVDALSARDSEKAREWMARHIADLKRGWEMAGRLLDDCIEQK
ncbi:FadR/GntR family transcriptional regulator [Paracoccus aerodenitrificans]|uniref:FadR/GntR family transcriptional regulator n=1 Tax=Paracoccus aerodenitrificans TaxID=3017781 RepID=UPI0022F10005|nr:FCD domain-containing protein [Paracoccus aerodenitrificans]WBU62745.1 FCD domain-containing protein [Paracoccus aerodenitrificans]